MCKTGKYQVVAEREGEEGKFYHLYVTPTQRDEISEFEELLQIMDWVNQGFNGLHLSGITMKFIDNRLMFRELIGRGWKYAEMGGVPETLVNTFGPLKFLVFDKSDNPIARADSCQISNSSPTIAAALSSSLFDYYSATNFNDTVESLLTFHNQYNEQNPRSNLLGWLRYQQFYKKRRVMLEAIKNYPRY